MLNDGFAATPQADFSQPCDTSEWIAAQALRGSIPQSLEDAPSGSPTADPALDEHIAVNDASVPIFDTGIPCGDVTVDSPEKQSDKLGTHRFTTYLVTGTLYQTSFTSRKRYSDFVWFRLTLFTHLPGVFFPTLPSKQHAGRFDAPFIEHRRLRLQQFLRRVFRHPEVCRSPVVITFLTSTPAELEKMKAEFGSRPYAEIHRDYRNSFLDIIVSSAAPPSDERFIMLKLCFQRQLKLLRAAQASLQLLEKEQSSAVSKMTTVEQALRRLADDEIAFMERNPSISSHLRERLLSRLGQNIRIEDAGASRTTHVLIAFLQREVEDCLAALEAFFSIEVLQKRITILRSRTASDVASWSDLRCDVEWLPEAASGHLPSARTSLVGLRKRDKTKELFGKVASGLKNAGARAGINRDRRLTELDASIRKGPQEIAALEELINASRIVLSACEIARFIETKVAGCLRSQDEFGAQRTALYRQLAECWSRPIEAGLRVGSDGGIACQAAPLDEMVGDWNRGLAAPRTRRERACVIS